MNRLTRNLATVAAAVVLAALLAAALTVLFAHSGSNRSIRQDPRVAALDRFLGRHTPKGVVWRAHAGRDGPHWQAAVPSIGVFDLSATTDEVVVAALEPAGGRYPVNPAKAMITAAAFADAHGGRRGLILRSTAVVHPEGDGEQDFLWQARQGAAWLPSYVDVAVRNRDGAVASYSRQNIKLTISTTPGLSRDAAVDVARHAIAAPDAPITAAPDLEVNVLPEQGQVLVWLIALAPRTPASQGIQAPAVLAVDAHTGRLLKE